MGNSWPDSLENPVGNFITEAESHKDLCRPICNLATCVELCRGLLGILKPASHVFFLTLEFCTTKSHHNLV